MMNSKGTAIFRPTHNVDQESLSVILPAKEVSVSLELAGEEESSLQWCVIHPHLSTTSSLFTILLIVVEDNLLVPVRVALLNAETVDGAVASVHHTKLLASLSQCQVYRNAAVTEQKKQVRISSMSRKGVKQGSYEVKNQEL